MSGMRSSSSPSPPRKRVDVRKSPEAENIDLQSRLSDTTWLPASVKPRVVGNPATLQYFFTGILRIPLHQQAYVQNALAGLWQQVSAETLHVAVLCDRASGALVIRRGGFTVRSTHAELHPLHVAQNFQFDVNLVPVVPTAPRASPPVQAGAPRPPAQPTSGRPPNYASAHSRQATPTGGPSARPHSDGSAGSQPPQPLNMPGMQRDSSQLGQQPCIVFQHACAWHEISAVRPMAGGPITLSLRGNTTLRGWQLEWRDQYPQLLRALSDEYKGKRSSKVVPTVEICVTVAGPRTVLRARWKSDRSGQRWRREIGLVATGQPAPRPQPVPATERSSPAAVAPQLSAGVQPSGPRPLSTTPLRCAGLAPSSAPSSSASAAPRRTSPPRTSQYTAIQDDGPQPPAWDDPTQRAPIPQGWQPATSSWHGMTVWRSGQDNSISLSLQDNVSLRGYRLVWNHKFRALLDELDRDHRSPETRRYVPMVQICVSDSEPRTVHYAQWKKPGSNRWRRTLTLVTLTATAGASSFSSLRPMAAPSSANAVGRTGPLSAGSEATGYRSAVSGQEAPGGGPPPAPAAQSAPGSGNAATSSRPDKGKAPLYPPYSQAPAARPLQSSSPPPLQPPSVSEPRNRPGIEAGELAIDDLSAKWHSIWIDSNGSDPNRGGNKSLLSLRQSTTLQGWRLEWGESYPALIRKIRGKRAGNWLDGDSLLQIKVSRNVDPAGARRVSHLRFKEEADRIAWTVWDFARDL